MVADITFFKRTFGVCVFRSPHLKKNLFWKICRTETKALYAFCRYQLERRGFELKAIVIDGKLSVREVFNDIPTQVCHFHQLQIITRYLTTRPKLIASQELRRLSSTLTKNNEKRFTVNLEEWYSRWEIFLKEKTINPYTNSWFYTHKRLRSAYHSLKNNLPYLFTYQKYPYLNIPNTTNSLDGSFSHLKEKVKLHRGLKAKRKLKIIFELLSNTDC